MSNTWKAWLFNETVKLALKVEKLFTDQVEVTIFVRNPNRPDADMMVSSEKDIEVLIAAIRENAKNEEIKLR